MKFWVRVEIIFEGYSLPVLSVSKNIAWISRYKFAPLDDGDHTDHTTLNCPLSLAKLFFKGFAYAIRTVRNEISLLMSLI